MGAVTAVVLVLFGVLVFMALLSWIGMNWPLKRVEPRGPYSVAPLRRADTLRYTTLVLIKRYMIEMEDLDNRRFDLRKAAICRETGRIFPDCVAWNGKIHVDWTFINKRFPGSWVSYGSLPEERRLVLWELHGTLEGFQTEFSSGNPLPQDIESDYAVMKPGPLYVNLENDVVMGWKIIPGTDAEILVVKRPKTYI